MIKDESTYMTILANTFIAAVFTSLILFTIGYFLKFVPNEIPYEFIKTTFVMDINDFKPESAERLQYMILTVLFPILFTALYWLNSKIKRTLLHNKLITYCLLFSSILWLLLAILIFMIEIRIIQYNIFLTIIFGIFVLALNHFYGRTTLHNQKRINIFLLILCVLSSIFISGIYIRKMYGFIYLELYNFDAYYYPVFEVFYGKILTVDFHNNYGFYPYILAPILKLTGPISIIKFSMAMATMVFIILLSFLSVIWTNIKNKMLCLFGYLALLCSYFILPLYLSHRIYLAYIPHRVFFPAIIMLISNSYLHTTKNAHKTILIIVGFMTACLSIIWNFDTGFVVIGAWCLFLLYVNAVKYSLHDFRFYKKSAKYVGLSVLTLAASLLIIIGITYIKSGILLSLNSLFLSQSVFYKYGFFMMPIPKYHVWAALIFIYSLGLMISLRKTVWVNVSDDGISSQQTSLFFLLSIIGMGIFSYYQGRSLDPVFLAVTWPGMIMVILLIQYFYDRAILVYKSTYVQKKLLYVNNILQVCSYLIILIPFFIAFPNITVRDNYFRPMLDLSNNTYFSQVNLRYELLNRNINKNEDVDLFMLQPAYYYSMLGMKNPTNVGSCVDWFTKADYDKALTWLKTTNNIVIMDENMRSLLINYNSEEFYTIMNNFKIEKIGSNLYMCTRP